MAFVGMRQSAVRRRWILSGFIEVHTVVYDLARFQEPLREQPTPGRTFMLQEISPGQFEPGSNNKTITALPPLGSPGCSLQRVPLR